MTSVPIGDTQRRESEEGAVKIEAENSDAATS